MDGSIRIDVGLDTKSFEVQIRETRKELEELEKSYETEKNMKPFKGQEEDLKSLELEIEKTKNKLIGLINNQNKLENTDITKSTVEFGKQGTKVFSSLTKGAKKLVLGLIGIRTAYTIISKISQAAMNNNEKLGKQIESVWTGLGALLEPVIEILVSLFKKVATAVLYFISLLTHENYIEKANAAILKNREKQLKNQTKATKDLTKANEKFSASFDEINTVQEQTSATANNNQIEPFDNSLLFNIKDLSSTTIDFLDKLAEKIKPIWKIIKDVIDWAKDHKDLIITILGGTALLTLLSKIMGVTGVSGLLGINSILLGLAAIGVISIVINVKRIQESINEAKTAANILKSHQLEKTEQVKAEQQMTRASIEGFEARNEATEKLYDNLDSLVYEERAFQKRTYEMLHSMSKADIAAAKLSGEWEAQHTAIAESIKREEEYISTMYELVDQNKLSAKSAADARWNIQMFGEKLYGTGEEAKICAAAFSVTKDGAKELGEISDNTKTKLDKLGIFINGISGALNKLQDPTYKETQMLDDMGKVVEKLGNNFSKLPNEIEKTVDAFGKIPNQLNITVDTKKALNETSKLVNSMASITSKPQNIKITSTINTVQKAVDDLSKGLADMTKKNYKINLTFNGLSEAMNMGEFVIAMFGKPKNMATGGIHIVNNPGRGVISGGARYGEAGAEGIIPLTDESALNTLADAIGNRIIINATVINKMNSRIISKEVQQALVESGFAANI